MLALVKAPEITLATAEPDGNPPGELVFQEQIYHHPEIEANCRGEFHSRTRRRAPDGDNPVKPAEPEVLSLKMRVRAHAHERKRHRDTRQFHD